jgi:hypothetical protein
MIMPVMRFTCHDYACKGRFLQRGVGESVISGDSLIPSKVSLQTYCLHDLYLRDPKHFEIHDITFRTILFDLRAGALLLI